MILNLLKRITQAFEKENIPYMLSGSLALNSYSVPRMTLDIDIVIELRQENLDVFLSLFQNNYYIDNKTVRYETERVGMFNVIDHETGFKIDFILRKETDYRKLEFNRRRRIEILDFEVWIVSPEDLILSKIEWIQKLSSDKQMNDIQNLLTMPDLDKNYLLTWAKALNLKTFNLF